MPRMLAKLTTKAVKTIRKPGRHSDGGNLYLNVKESGSKSWLFIYRFAGKQREMGLGDLRKVGLARARKLARKAREQLGEGKDPILEKRQPTSIVHHAANGHVVRTIQSHFGTLFAIEGTGRAFADLPSAIEYAETLPSTPLQSVSQLVDIFSQWIKSQKLLSMSADDLMAEDITAEQRAWLQQFAIDCHAASARDSLSGE